MSQPWSCELALGGSVMRGCYYWSGASGDSQIGRQHYYEQRHEIELQQEIEGKMFKYGLDSVVHPTQINVHFCINRRRSVQL